MCESIGPAGTEKFNFLKDGKPDTTHLEMASSPVFARLVVEDLRKVVPALAPVLLTEPRAAKLTDIEYGQAGGEKLLLDVSVPAGDGLFPEVEPSWLIFSDSLRSSEVEQSRPPVSRTKATAEK